jgi:hypothetical protein
VQRDQMLLDTVVQVTLDAPASVVGVLNLLC